MKKLDNSTLVRVREYLKNYEATAPHSNFPVTAEHVSDYLGIKEHIVKQAFHKLNLEGSLSTAVVNHSNGWGRAASVYYPRKKNDEQRTEEN